MIALDATLWDEPTTGIGLYTHELYRALAALLPVERWGARRSGERPRGRRRRTVWTLGELGPALLRERPAVFHAVSNFNLPLVRVPGVPLVLTVHDLVPLQLPRTVSAAFRVQFLAWLSRSVQVADQLIAVSEHTRAALVDRFPAAAGKVTVIHHGVDHVDRVPGPDAITVKWLDALGLPPRWILYAGALDARKNVELVLDAAELLHRQGRPVSVVLAGQPWFGAAGLERKARTLRAGGVDVRVLGYLAPPVFYALMRRAPVFVFPSWLEGFGLPPLEAMALGVPTIISSQGALPEVCGDGARVVDPGDAGGLAEAIDRVLTCPDEAAGLRTRAREVASRYRWARTGSEVVEVYRRAGAALPVTASVGQASQSPGGRAPGPPAG